MTLTKDQEQSYIKADGRIDWPNLPDKDLAGRLSQIHFDIRRERRHLQEGTRSSLDVEARRVGVTNITGYNKPELIEAVLAKRFITDAESELAKASAREVI